MKNQILHRNHISHRRAAVHHGLHQDHPGIEKALIGAGVFGALVLTLAGIAVIAA